eukprot:1161316-Pelagomonas_calceolata.AAC.2
MVLLLGGATVEAALPPTELLLLLPRLAVRDRESEWTICSLITMSVCQRDCRADVVRHGGRGRSCSQRQPRVCVRVVFASAFLSALYAFASAAAISLTIALLHNNAVAGSSHCFLIMELTSTLRKVQKRSDYRSQTYVANLQKVQTCKPEMVLATTLKSHEPHHPILPDLINIHQSSILKAGLEYAVALNGMNGISLKRALQSVSSSHHHHQSCFPILTARSEHAVAQSETSTAKCHQIISCRNRKQSSNNALLWMLKPKEMV